MKKGDRVRMKHDWPPPPNDMTRAVARALGGDCSPLPFCSAGTWGTIVSDVGSAGLFFVQFDGIDDALVMSEHSVELIS